MWQTVADNPCGTDFDFTSFGINLFLESILPAMRLIRHDDDVMALRQRLMGFLKLLHRGEDDTVSLSAIEKFLQVLSAPRMNWNLPKKILTLGKLSIQLIIQVVTVSNDYNRRGIQRILQKMYIKDHRKGFPTALRMPEHTTSAVRRHAFLRRLNCLTNSKVLMVSGKDLELLQSFIGEADEILDDIKQSFFLEHAFKERIKLCVLCIFVATILRLPFHEPIFA